MFNIFKKDKDEPGVFTRLKQGLAKTRKSFTAGLSNIILGKKQIDGELLDEIETRLLMADVGVETTEQVIKSLTDNLSRKEISEPAILLDNLKQILKDILQPVCVPLDVNTHKPYVILMVGINGAGKTTSIGKLAKYLQNAGKKVMLAAGDTFRAAAIEQLQTWGERNNVPVISQQAGSDSASVVYDALQSAIARQSDVLLADTAGRLHTQGHLMEELKKVKRVMGKISATAPHEVLLVLDASIGQNALTQAQHFTQAVGVTGIILTKLDGTAKGGIIFAIANQLHIPIRFIGVGEAIDDLRPFTADEYVEALFED